MIITSVVSTATTVLTWQPEHEHVTMTTITSVVSTATIVLT